MKTLLVAILYMECAILPVNGESIANTDKSALIDTTIRLELDGGGVIERRVMYGNEVDLRDLKRIIGDRSGQFIVAIATRRDKESYSKEIRGRIEFGKIEGIVTTDLVIEGKHWLLSEETYKGDLRNGKSISYYPETKRPQMLGNFEKGYRNGVFNFFYPSGMIAAKISYTRGQPDGECDIYDRSGAAISSGTYEKGEKANGTFITDLGEFLMDSIRTNSITVYITNIVEFKQSGSLSKRKID